MPRAGLTPAIVIAAAADLADEVGWEELTLAALAGRLKVAVSSLYKHLDGLEAIRRGVAILALRDLGDSLDGALDGVDAAADRGSARVRALADAYRGFARAHPGRYAATVRASPPDDADHRAASDAVLRTVLGVLAERGLAGDAAIDAARGLRAALHGFVALEASGGFGLPRDIERSFAWMMDVLDRAIGPIEGRGRPDGLEGGS